LPLYNLSSQAEILTTQPIDKHKKPRETSARTWHRHHLCAERTQGEKRSKNILDICFFLLTARLIQRNMNKQTI
jgi:hypothetical protein